MVYRSRVIAALGTAVALVFGGCESKQPQQSPLQPTEPATRDIEQQPKKIPQWYFPQEDVFEPPKPKLPYLDPKDLPTEMYGSPGHPVNSVIIDIDKPIA